MANHTIKQDENEIQLVNHLKNRRFEEAEQLLHAFYQPHQFSRVLHQIAENKTGLITYTFITTLIQKYNSSFWHKIAAVIAAESLDHVQEGLNVGLYHVLKAIELNASDWQLKEIALGYHAKGLLDTDQAKVFAKEVLEHEPNNKLALKILDL
jgi:hypothetical protein